MKRVACKNLLKLGLCTVWVIALVAMGTLVQTGGGSQPSSGIPEITLLDFPKLIPPDGTQMLGTIGFRDPDADIISADFTVVKAVSFSPFSFDPHVNGKVDGIFQFLIYSELGQQVTLRVTLTDAKGNKSPPRTFSFVAGRPITPQIAFLTQTGSFGINDSQFDLPRGVAVDSTGNIYVADTGNHRIEKFGPNEQLMTKWGSFCDLLQNIGCVDSEANGQFDSPQGIAVDGAGNVYVADFANARIQKFDSNGRFLMKWGSRGNGDGQLNEPAGLAADASGNAYVTDFGNNRVLKFDANGKLLLQWGSLGADDGQLFQPRGIAIDGSGNIYVVDSGNDRVQKFSPNGALLAKWGVPGAGDGQFFVPFGIAIDSKGNVYVTDSLNHRVQAFDPSGHLLAQWGRLGRADGLFNTPTGIAIDADGNIYVLDSVNSRIQKFAGMVGDGTPSLSPVEARVAFQIRIGATELPPPGEDFTADIVLKYAADGLQRYELIFEVNDSDGAGAIARIEKIESRTINPEHFQIVQQSDFSVRFKAIDVGNAINPGATDIVLATITLRVLKLGPPSFSLEIPQAGLVNAKGHEVNSNEVLILPTTFGGR